MNGLNKNRNKIRNQTYALSIIYVMAAIFIIVSLINEPRVMNGRMNKKVADIQANIKKNLMQDDLIVNEMNLEDIVQSHPMQLIVKQNESIIYTNMQLNDETVLDENTIDDVVFYKAQFTVNDYDVWLLIYNESVDSVVTNSIAFFVICLIIMTIILILTIKSQFNLMFKPLSKIYWNIMKYKRSGKDDVEYRMNIFTNELQNFVGDVQERLDSYKITYTNLESELLQKKAKSEYKNQQVSSLVHNIKTPLNIIKLSTDILRDTVVGNNKSINDIDDSANHIFDDVQNILKVINSNDEMCEKTDVNIVDELKRTLTMYSGLFKEKKILITLESIAAAYIRACKVEIQSALDNIFSNIYYYSTDNSEVYIDLDYQNNKYILKIYNEPSNINAIDFKNSFNLLERKTINGKKNTGLGLFIIEAFIEHNDGKYYFYQEDNRVVNHLEFEGEQSE